MPTEPQDQIFCAHVFKGHVLGQPNHARILVLGRRRGSWAQPSTYFDLSQQSLSLGGSIIAITSISQTDDGTGPEGLRGIHLPVRASTSCIPASILINATNWTLVARYISGVPLGKTAWFKFRSDLYLMTEEGARLRC